MRGRRATLPHIFYVRPEHLSHAPCLSDATARTMRCVAFTNFRDVAETSILQVIFERLEPCGGLTPCGFGILIHFEICSDEWSHEPRPDRSLVIRPVSF